MLGRSRFVLSLARRRPIQRFAPNKVDHTFGRLPSTIAFMQSRRDLSTTPSGPEIPAVDSAAAAIVDAVANIPELTNNPTHLVMKAIEYIHLTADIPYWGAIVATTVGLRFFLLPIAIKTVQNAARMAAMRPDMQKIQDALSKDPNMENMQVKLRYQKEMQSLFVKYKVNPFRSLMMPFIQLPIFISLFFGLKEMGTFFPAMASGGAFWFTDLTVADPYLIFPVINAVSFLLMVEMGSDGLQTSQQQTFKWGMRGLAVAMAPLTMSIPQCVFVYWSTNNALSIVQTIVLKQESIRKYLEIPKPPPAEEQIPLRMKNPFKAAVEVIEKQVNASTAKPEIVDGSQAPPPPPTTAPPPVTFSTPPKVKKSS